MKWLTATSLVNIANIVLGLQRLMFDSMEPGCQRSKEHQEHLSPHEFEQWRETMALSQGPSRLHRPPVEQRLKTSWGASKLVVGRVVCAEVMKGGHEALGTEYVGLMLAL
jgi:hypothetical protein